MPKRGVVVAHSGRQHSHQLAYALNEVELLQRYCVQKLPLEYIEHAPQFLKKLKFVRKMQGSSTEIPIEKFQWQAIPSLTVYILTRIVNRSLASWVELFGYRVFDRWAARIVRREMPLAVVGYEPSCATTFVAAKKFGITCILDAASFHYAFQDRVLEEEKIAGETAPGKLLRRRKAEEIELADWIFCTSSLARQSYVDGGVPPEKVVALPLGSDLEKFSPAPVGARTGIFKIAYVGLPIKRKNFDGLLRVAGRLAEKNIPVELHVFGNRAAAITMGAVEVPGRVILRGSFSHDKLAEEIRLMDCLVLPSLFDSFGFTVIEALASGVPAIVSDRVGAKMAIAEGQSGWIVPAGDEAALADRIAQLVVNPEIARGMSERCVEAAQPYSWRHYHCRIQAFFTDLQQGRLKTIVTP